MPGIDHLLSRASENRRALLMLASLALVFVLALNVVVVFLPMWLPTVVEAQIDLSGRTNFAALATAGFGIASVLVAGLRVVSARGGSRFLWATVAVACLDISLVDLLIDRPASRLYVPAAILLAGSCLWLLKRQTRIGRLAWIVLAAALVLAVANPVMDRYEVALAGDPGNYAFVSAGEPYQMTTSSWRRLALVRQAQEASETALLILLFQLLLLDVSNPRKR